MPPAFVRGNEVPVLQAQYDSWQDRKISFNLD